MKTRNILMFTASVTSLTSVSTADSDNMLAFEQAASAIAMASGSILLPSDYARLHAPARLSLTARLTAVRSIDANC